MKLPQFVDSIRNHPEFGPATTYYRHLPPVEAVYEGTPPLSPPLLSALQRLGIQRLFKHQVDAIRCVQDGKHVLIATPTASGKSLVFNLSVVETLLRNRSAKALYVFPLKALEQDQLKNLNGFIEGMQGIQVSARIYDGDTSAYARKQIRTRVPEILVTNPDMLHSGILAYHESWEKLFENLSYVIFDEVHTYRGIFGSHMNQVIRRLKRICRHYGSNPQFILLSATVNNPQSFGESLVEETMEVINVSGAPRSGQHFLFLNPLAGPNFSAAKLFVHCLQSGFRTIAFTQSRKITELIHLWVSRLAPKLKDKISSYRAGFMPEERRDIERRLASGDLLGVVSTSALEMGIDIGYLDICLLVGYPGTMINTWQRGGRVGRSGRESLIILVAKPDALDQYFMKHPSDFFERPLEAAVLDPHNPYVVESHLPCAAAEHPITMDDSRYWSKNLAGHLENLEKQGALARTADGPPTWFCPRRNPHQGVNIRSVGASYTIFEKETGQAIGTVDGIRALKECHPGAVYLHRAQQYLVDHLLLDKRDIIAHPSDLQYFTRSLSEKETEIIEVTRSRPKEQFVVREGRVKVTERIVGYEKRALPGQELLGTQPLDLPPQVFETMGFWIEIEDAFYKHVEKAGLHFMGGIHAVEHATIGIFPLFALCDRNDIGGISHTHHPQIGKSAIFIYDGYPGGVGLAQHGFEMVTELLEKTLDLVSACECEEGCPSCIHSPKCGNGNRPLDKKAAIMVLELLLGRRAPDEISCDETEAALECPPGKQDVPENARRGPRIIYLDLETQRSAQEVGGWRNCHLMKISVAGVYDTLEERFRIFREDQIDELLALIEKADLIVGFNIKRFDYDVLKGYTAKDLKELPTFDILEDIHRRLGYRLSLDHLAVETLHRGKSGDGLQALEWFKMGEMEKLSEYCLLDVEITKALFEYGLEKGHIVYRTKQEDQRVLLRVDWNLANMIQKATCNPRDLD